MMNLMQKTFGVARTLPFGSCLSMSFINESSLTTHAPSGQG